jgi:3-oxoacyl-[acyl-carrier-protein] synthase II
VATQLGISLEIRGPAICISTACTSSTDAIGLAWLQIQGGLLDRAIVGGSDAPITPLLFASFDRLGVMSRHNEHPEAASRPFAHSRDGFVMSEGAGICILEAEDAARERGAPIFAELAGYGATSDGFHSFSPLPTGDEGARAIHQALAAGSIDPATVDYVSAHAIGSRPNDPIEIEIINRVFGERAPLVPISAVKSMIGHTMGASGVLELIGCVQTLQTGCIPPTINLMEEDLLSGLDLVPNHARRAEVHVALAPTFGFGSRNGVLALRHYES